MLGLQIDMKSLDISKVRNMGSTVSFLNSIMWYMKYIFYRIYRWQCGLQPREQWAAQNALAGVAALVYIYLFLLLVLTNFVFPSFSLLSVSGQHIALVMVLFAALILGIPYFKYIRAGRYKHIVAQFHTLKETTAQAALRGWLIVLAYVIPIIAIVIIAVVTHSRE